MSTQEAGPDTWRRDLSALRIELGDRASTYMADEFDHGVWWLHSAMVATWVKILLMVGA